MPCVPSNLSQMGKKGSCGKRLARAAALAAIEFGGQAEAFNFKMLLERTSDKATRQKMAKTKAEESAQTASSASDWSVWDLFGFWNLFSSCRCVPIINDTNGMEIQIARSPTEETSVCPIGNENNVLKTEAVVPLSAYSNPNGACYTHALADTFARRLDVAMFLSDKDFDRYEFLLKFFDLLHQAFVLNVGPLTSKMSLFVEARNGRLDDFFNKLDTNLDRQGKELWPHYGEDMKKFRDKDNNLFTKFFIGTFKEIVAKKSVLKIPEAQEELEKSIEDRLPSCTALDNNTCRMGDLAMIITGNSKAVKHAFPDKFANSEEQPPFSHAVSVECWQKAENNFELRFKNNWGPEWGPLKNGRSHVQISAFDAKNPENARTILIDPIDRADGGWTSLWFSLASSKNID